MMQQKGIRIFHIYIYNYLSIYLYIRKGKEIPKSFNNKTSLLNEG